MKEVREISWVSFWRIAFVVLFLVLLFFLRSVLVIFIFAAIIAAAFEPVVNWFERRGIGRILGAVFVYLVGLVIVGGILFFLLPIVYQQFLSAIDLIPGYSEKILNSVIGSPFAAGINDIIMSYGGSIIKSSATILSVLFNIVGGLASAISILLISFYLLIRREGINDFLRKVIPQGIGAKVVSIWERCLHRFGRWFRTQLLLSVFIGVLVFFVLWALGVKYSLVLGLAAGIFEIVPIAGPIFAGALSAIVAATDSFSLAIWVVISFIVIHQLESNVLVPLTMKKSVGINPVILILGIFAGGKLGGIIGIILAAPVLIILEEVMAEVDNRKVKSGDG